jgi:hypothetical protein
VIGKKKVGSSEAHVVEATPAQGKPEKFYFDVNTGLLVRHDTERYSGTSRAMVPTEEYLTDYKVVNGVKTAHTVKTISSEFTITVKVEEVEYNVEIEEGAFDKPAGN